MRGGLDKAVEVVDGAEPRLDRQMAACVRSDGPRAARISRLGGQRVVAPLAMRPADRMDRRKVDDVEAHRGDVHQPRLGLAESGAARWIRRARPRKHLVPRSEAGTYWVDRDAQHAVVGRL